MPRTGFEQLKKETYFRAMDYWLLVPIMIICVIGLWVLNKVMSTGFKEYPTIFYKQIGAVMIGVLIALILCVVEVPTLKLVGWGIYCISLILLIIIPFDGYIDQTYKWGADSWLYIKEIGSFQPSELAKVGLAMASAFIFEDMRTKKIKMWKGSLLLLLIYGVPLALIMYQPDFGTAMVIVFMFICMLFIWGLRWRYVLLGSSGLVILGILAWFFYFSEKQKARIITFLYPGHDPTASFSLIQSKLAIASGGLTGSTRDTPIRVPVKETDFIYTAISEHMGLIGTTALLLLIIFFLIRCLYVASKVQSTRPALAYILVGLTAAMSFHFIENLGMCVGLLPITGIPLPFVSAGGTAMVVNFIALGVILSVSMERNINS